LATARAEQFRSVRLIELLARYGYMAAAKAVMGFLGVDVGAARLPHAQLTADNKKRLQVDLEKLGFFDWLQAPAAPV
jgi:N-acetylneuraminate lyase